MKKIEKIEKIFRGKLSKLSVSYYVLITKVSFLGHFCLTHRLTDSLTHKLTHGRKGRVTELHVAAKNVKDYQMTVEDCQKQLKTVLNTIRN